MPEDVWISDDSDGDDCAPGMVLLIGKLVFTNASRSAWASSYVAYLP